MILGPTTCVNGELIRMSTVISDRCGSAPWSSSDILVTSYVVFDHLTDDAILSTTTLLGVSRDLAYFELHDVAEGDQAVLLKISSTVIGHAH